MNANPDPNQTKTMKTNLLTAAVAQQTLTRRAYGETTATVYDLISLKAWHQVFETASRAVREG